MLSLKEKGSKKKQILGSVEILRKTGGGWVQRSSKHFSLCSKYLRQSGKNHENFVTQYVHVPLINNLEHSCASRVIRSKSESDSSKSPIQMRHFVNI